MKVRLVRLLEERRAGCWCGNNVVRVGSTPRAVIEESLDCPQGGEGSERRNVDVDVYVLSV